MELAHGVLIELLRVLVRDPVVRHALEAAGGQQGWVSHRNVVLKSELKGREGRNLITLERCS